MYKDTIYLHTDNELEDFIDEKREISFFSNKKINIFDLNNWGLTETGSLAHESGKFFSIKSVMPSLSQKSILHQKDIGFLCLFKTLINGQEYYLLQCKAEPGNKNKFQWSPTIQATKSNFSKVHKGKIPSYFDLLVSILNGTKKGKILSDSLLPEQGEIYWQKYNRNIIIETDFIQELDGFKWFSKIQVLRELGKLSEINSCLRSILSLEFCKPNKLLATNPNFQTQLCNISQGNKGNFELSDCLDLNHTDNGDLCLLKKCDDLIVTVVGLEVNIDGREVGSWEQPIVTYSKESTKVAVRVKSNGIGIGWIWSINKQAGYLMGCKVGLMELPQAHRLFNSYSDLNPRNISTVNLPEEGGRFLHVNNCISFFEIDVLNIELVQYYLKEDENISILTDYESANINQSGMLEMDARSALTLMPVVYCD